MGTEVKQLQDDHLNGAEFAADFHGPSKSVISEWTDSPPGWLMSPLCFGCAGSALRHVDSVVADSL